MKKEIKILLVTVTAAVLIIVLNIVTGTLPILPWQQTATVSPIETIGLSGSTGYYVNGKKQNCSGSELPIYDTPGVVQNLWYVPNQKNPRCYTSYVYFFTSGHTFKVLPSGSTYSPAPLQVIKFGPGEVSGISIVPSEPVGGSIQIKTDPNVTAADKNILSLSSTQLMVDGAVYSHTLTLPVGTHNVSIITTSSIINAPSLPSAPVNPLPSPATKPCLTGSGPVLPGQVHCDSPTTQPSGALLPATQSSTPTGTTMRYETCSYDTGVKECQTPGKYVSVPACTVQTVGDKSVETCNVPVDVASNKTVKVTFKKVASNGGSVQVYFVKDDKDSFGYTFLDNKAKIDDRIGPGTVVSGVSSGSHVLNYRMTFINNNQFGYKYTAKYEICTYDIGGTECKMPGTYALSTKCDVVNVTTGSQECAAPVNVEPGKVTKIVLQKYSTLATVSENSACLVIGAGQIAGIAAFDVATHVRSYYPDYKESFPNDSVSVSIKCDAKSSAITESYNPTSIDDHRIGLMCPYTATGIYSPVVGVKFTDFDKSTKINLGVLNLGDKKMDGDWRNVLTYLYDNGAIDHVTGVIDATRIANLVDKNHDSVATINEVMDFLTAAKVNLIKRAAVNVVLKVVADKKKINSIDTWQLESMISKALVENNGQASKSPICIPNPTPDGIMKMYQ